MKRVEIHVLCSVLWCSVIVTKAVPIDQTAQIGDDATLSCPYGEITDGQSVIIDWSREVTNVVDGWQFLASGGEGENVDSNVPNKDKYLVTSGQDSFTIFEVSQSDEGLYRGQVSIYSPDTGSPDETTCKINLQVVEATTVATTTPIKGSSDINNAADNGDPKLKSSDSGSDSESSALSFSANTLLTASFIFVVKIVM
ncbi:uncharacterized protein LOC144440480 [Glandiceps talaboti]